MFTTDVSGAEHDGAEAVEPRFERFDPAWYHTVKTRKELDRSAYHPFWDDRPMTAGGGLVPRYSLPASLSRAWASVKGVFGGVFRLGAGMGEEGRKRGSGVRGQESSVTSEQ